MAKLVGVLEPGDTVSTAATRTSATRSGATARRESARSVRRLRRVGRRLGVRGRLLPDGRRRPGAGRDGCGPSFEALAPEDGWAHVGRSGAGHFVKMVHNGIEYGLMQAYAEGFELMHHSEFELDLQEIAGIWRYGSVVRSWLLELLHAAFEEQGSELDGHRPVRRGLRRRPLDARTRRSQSPCRCRCSPSSLFARFASRRDDRLRREGGRGAAEPVRRARRPAASREATQSPHAG